MSRPPKPLSTSLPLLSGSAPQDHPDLDFCVGVTIYERDGRYMATAALAEDSRDVGVGDTPQEAVGGALRVLGEPYASEMAEPLSLRDATDGSIG